MKPRRLSNWSSAAVMLIFSSSWLWNLGLLSTLRVTEEFVASGTENSHFIPVPAENLRLTSSRPKNVRTSFLPKWDKLPLRKTYVTPSDLLISPDKTKPPRLWPSSRQTSLRRFKSTARDLWERLGLSRPPRSLNVNEVHEKWEPGMLVTNDLEAETYVKKFDPDDFKRYLSKTANQAKKNTKESTSLKFFGALAEAKVAEMTPQHLITRLNAFQPVFSHTEAQADITKSAMPDATEPLALISSATDRNGPEVTNAEKGGDGPSTKNDPSKNEVKASQPPVSDIENGKTSEKRVRENQAKMLQLELGSVHYMVLRLPEVLRKNAELTDAIHEVYSLIWWRNKLTHPGISSLVKRLSEELNTKLPRESRRILEKPQVFHDR